MNKSYGPRGLFIILTRHVNTALYTQCNESVIESTINNAVPVINQNETSHCSR